MKLRLRQDAPVLVGTSHKDELALQFAYDTLQKTILSPCPENMKLASKAIQRISCLLLADQCKEVPPECKDFLAHK